MDSTIIHQFYLAMEKIAQNENISVPKWTGVSASHRAIAENPKDYYSGELKASLFGTIPGIIIPLVAGIGATVLTKKNILKKFPDLMSKTQAERDMIAQKIMGKLQLNTTSGMIGGGFLGGYIGNKMYGEKYLKDRGIKQDIFGRYSLTPEAATAYSDFPIQNQ